MYQQQMFNVLNTSFSIGCAGQSAPRMFFTKTPTITGIREPVRLLRKRMRGTASCMQKCEKIQEEMCCLQFSKMPYPS